eukprot:3056958-Pleurochrysis_carterae.AAC.1
MAVLDTMRIEIGTCSSRVRMNASYSPVRVCSLCQTRVCSHLRCVHDGIPGAGTGARTQKLVARTRRSARGSLREGC